MKNKTKIVFFSLLSLGILLVIGLIVLLCLQSNAIAMLNPKGAIALQQKKLLITATWLMLIVVIPVFILTVFFAWKYRSSNRKAKYLPEWDQNLTAEIIWFSVPFAIVIVLSVLVWKSSYELDPFKPLVSETKPMKIQVVALQWKWLFIYPEQGIATVGFVKFPEKTPINFEITSDAPMNSFWIPQLGGQIYAMAGMNTQMHLIANEPGDFKGCSANISGKGFAGMTFVASALSRDDFDNWVHLVQQEEPVLGLDSYQVLALPSENQPPASYRLGKEDLYKWIIMKYMHPQQAEP